MEKKSAIPATVEKEIQEERVMQYVASGQVDKVMEDTGRAFSLSGTIVEGNKIGRTLGYPTANLDPDKHTAVLPGQGVYTALVQLGSRWFESMVNVGIRPTLNLKQVTIEAHLFGASGNLYGQRMSVHLLAKLRDEMRFSSLPELKAQLDADRETAFKAMAGMRPHLTCKADEVLYAKSS